MSFKKNLFAKVYSLKCHCVVSLISILSIAYRFIIRKNHKRVNTDLYRDVKKILIIQLLKLGDMIVTTPSIRAVKQRFPYAHISVMAIPIGESVLSGNPFINEILIYERKSWFGYTRFIKELRAKNFDLVLDFHNTFFSLRRLLIPFLTGARYRIGFKRKGFQGFLNTQEVVWLIAVKHEAESYLDLVRVLGVEPKTKNLEIHYSEEDEVWARECLKEHGIFDGDLVICIHPASKNASKLWLSDRFAVVADGLITKYKARVIFTGTKDEKIVSEEIMNLMKQGAHNLAGKTNLKTLFALIARCNLLITIDTSSVHIAAAVNTPTVALYGPTNAVAWAPWNKNNQIMIRKDFDCSPCDTDFEKKFRCIKGDYPCIKEIMPGEVLKAADFLLKEGRILQASERKHETVIDK